MRHRADKLIEGWCAENGRDDVNVEAMTQEELVAFIRDNQVPCPGCGKSDFTDIRKFNLMFKTHQGVTEDTTNEVYLRPGDRPGHFRQLPQRPAHHPQEAAFRSVPDRQVLPQRDHPR